MGIEMVCKTSSDNKDATPSTITERKVEAQNAKVSKGMTKVLRGLAASLMAICVFIICYIVIGFGLLYKCPTMNAAIFQVSLVSLLDFNPETIIWKFAFMLYHMAVTVIVIGTYWKCKGYKHEWVDEFKHL